MNALVVFGALLRAGIYLVGSIHCFRAGSRNTAACLFALFAVSVLFGLGVFALVAVFAVPLSAWVTIRLSKLAAIEQTHKRLRPR